MTPSVPLVAKEVVMRKIAGEVLLVPVGRDVVDMDRLFVLNRVGAFLWEQLDGVHTRDELCAMVREQFEVADAQQVEADVDLFLSQLQERGLAVPVPVATGAR